MKIKVWSRGVNVHCVQDNPLKKKIPLVVISEADYNRLVKKAHKYDSRRKSK